MKQNRNKKLEKNTNWARPRHGTAVPRSTVGRATTHGRASTTHGRACRARLAVRAGTASRTVAVPVCGLLPGVHGRAPLWHARALSCFPLLP